MDSPLRPKHLYANEGSPAERLAARLAAGPKPRSGPAMGKAKGGVEVPSGSPGTTNLRISTRQP